MKFRITTCKSAKVTDKEMDEYGIPKRNHHFGRAWFFFFPRFYTNKGIPFKSKMFHISFQWLCYDLTFYIENYK